MKKKIIISSLSFLVFTSVLILNLSLGNNKSTLKDFSLGQIFEMNLALGEEGEVCESCKPEDCIGNWIDCYALDGTCYPDTILCDGVGC